METGISLWLSQWARRQPDKDLLVLEDETISWGDFDERVTRLANALEGLGVTPGDRVGVLLRNCPEFLQSYWAALRRGAIFIPLNVHLAPSELAWVITNADIKVVVTDEQFDAAVTEVAPTVPVEHWISAKGTLGIAHHALADLVAQASPVLRPVPIAMSDPLGIFYTSGTTGLPKGAVLTHGNVFHSTLNWMVDLGLGHDDLHLNFLPLCFTGGIVSGSMWVFHAGATMVLEREFDAGRVLELIERHRVTFTMGVPTMFKMVMDHPSFPTADLSSLRTLMIGAAPVPVAMLETYQARGVATIQGYGLTEAGGFNLYLSAADSVRKVGSTGVEALYCQVKAVNDADQETAPGEVGELLVAGPCVTPGYWRNEEATAAAFLDGWLRTGDLVTRDEEGYYTVVDRKKDMVISGGLNVYPAEVESVLFGFEEIAEAAVVGLPDEKWGERVTAFIKLHPGRELTADEVIARCRRDLAAYKVPKQVEFVDEMPKTVSGKIQKRVLRDQYGRPNEPSGAGAGADA